MNLDRHIPTEMINPSGLVSRIQKLASPGLQLASAARYLSGNSRDELLKSLLLELDETILPREFRLTTDAGSSAILKVVRRRLFLPDGVVAAHQSSLENTLQYLQSVLLNAQKVSIVRTRVCEPFSGFGAGISLFTLIGAVLTNSEAQSELSPDATLLSTLKPGFSAWLLLDNAGNITQKGGDPTENARLGDLVRNDLSEMKTQLSQSLTDRDGPGCLILMSDSGNGQALIYARSKQRGLLALAPIRNLSVLQKSLHAFTGAA